MIGWGPPVQVVEHVAEEDWSTLKRVETNLKQSAARVVIDGFEETTIYKDVGGAVFLKR